MDSREERQRKNTQTPSSSSRLELRIGIEIGDKPNTRFQKTQKEKSFTEAALQAKLL